MKRHFAILLFAAFAFAQTAAPQQPLTIESIFQEGGITGRAPEDLKWSPDGTKFSFVQRDDSGERGELWYVDAATGNKAVLVNADKLASLAPPSSRVSDDRQKEWAQRYHVGAYHWAPDSKHLLFATQGQLWIYSLGTGIGLEVTSSPDAASDPKFSPDGSRVAFVRKHQLWVREFKAASERALTRSGDEKLLNGEVDWVYAEELDVRSNYFWSPNGKQLAYLQMDENRVPVYPIVDWMPQHPHVDNQIYPKAGDSNPVVRVGVVDAEGGNTRWIKLPGLENTAAYYTPRFGWLRDGWLYIQVLNRAQNRLDLYFAEASSGHARLVLSEASKTWVPVTDDFRVLKAGDRFLWSSWRDGRTHVYLYKFNSNEPMAAEAVLERQLTRGDYDVFGVEAVDEPSGLVFVTTNRMDPRQRQVDAVRLDGKGEPQRITPEPGTHEVSFAPNAHYYADTYSALMRPGRLSFCSVQVGVHASNPCTPVWQARSVPGTPLSTPERIELKAADGSTTLYGYLLLPPRAKSAPAASIPLILNPYGGPGRQYVRDAWGGTTFLFHQLMARAGFAVLEVDNRGMSGRGQPFEAAARRSFGKLEWVDQLAALDQVLERYPALDAKRVGMWGWSFGAYLTLYGMTHSDRIRAGVAVAPVADWTLYDSIYTERYMGLPRDNVEAYRDGSPAASAGELKGRVLMVHGSSDDNVHMQNTIHMVQALIAAGVPYDLQIYPGKTHGISGATARTHLYQRILSHFEDHLKRATGN